MAYSDYVTQWNRQIQDPSGVYRGNRKKFYEDILEGIVANEERFRGVTAEDIGKVFVEPEMAERRRNFDRALDSGYARALRNEASRLKREGLRLGVPGTGAMTRMEGTLGRPEGLSASASRASKRNEFEEQLRSNQGMMAPITNIAPAIMGEHAKHAGRAGIASKAMTGAATGFGLAAAANPLLAIPAAVLAAAAGATELGTAEEGRKAALRAAKFSPQSYTASRRTTAAPAGGLGLDYNPYGSNEGMLGNVYGGRRRKQDEGNYLFGGMG